MAIPANITDLIKKQTFNPTLVDSELQQYCVGEWTLNQRDYANKRPTIVANNLGYFENDTDVIALGDGDAANDFDVIFWCKTTGISNDYNGKAFFMLGTTTDGLMIDGSAADGFRFFVWVGGDTCRVDMSSFTDKLLVKRTRFIRFKKRSNDGNNWEWEIWDEVNGLQSITGLTPVANDLLSTDVLSFTGTAILARDTGSFVMQELKMGEIAIVDPLTDVERDAIINNGYQKYVDEISTINIIRQWKNIGLYENTGSYYIREEVTNNDNYALAKSYVTLPGDAVDKTHFLPIAFDQSLQYNHAKATGIDVLHGRLLGFTDDEIGGDNRMKTPSIRDIYRTNLGTSSGFRFNDVNTNYINLTNPTGISVTGDWTLYALIRVVNNAPLCLDSRSWIFNSGTSGVDFIAMEIQKGGTFSQVYTCSIWVNDGGTNVELGVGSPIFESDGYTDNPTKHERWIILTASKTKVQANNQEAFFPTPSVPINTTLNANTEIGRRNTGVDRFNEAILELGMVEGDLDFNQVLKLKRDILNGNEPDHSFRFRIQNVTEDVSGNGHHPILNGITSTETNEGNKIIERPSGLPAITHGLRSLQPSSHHAKIAGFVPTKTDGYTVIIGFNLDSDRNFAVADHDNFISKRNGADFIIVYGAASTKVMVVRFKQVVTFTINLAKYDLSKPILVSCFLTNDTNWPGAGTQGYWESSVNGHVIETRAENAALPIVAGFDEITADTFIGNDTLGAAGRYLDGDFHCLGIAKGYVQPKHIKEIWNNGQFKQPLPRWGYDWQLWPNFNRPVDPTGTPSLEDLALSLNSGAPSNTVLLQNYTANELDDTHGEYKFIDINTLR